MPRAGGGAGRVLQGGVQPARAGCCLLSTTLPTWNSHPIPKLRSLPMTMRTELWHSTNMNTCSGRSIGATLAACNAPTPKAPMHRRLLVLPPRP